MTRSARLRLWLGWGVAALALGLAALAVQLTSHHQTQRAFGAAVMLVVGWSCVLTGLVAWTRRPSNNSGRLLVWVGFSFFLGTFNAANNRILYTLGEALGAVVLAAFAHLLLVYPEGTLRTRLERAVLFSGYALAGVANVLTLMFTPHPQCDTCATNFLLVEHDDRVARAVTNAADGLAAVIIFSVLVLVIRRWRAATPVAKRALVPVQWTGGPTLAFFVVSFAIGPLSHGAQTVAVNLALLTFALLPWAFLAGLLRLRLARGSVARLLVGVPETATLEETEGALRDALADPGLRVGAWLPERCLYVDPAGHPFAVADDETRVATMVSSEEGARLAVIDHDVALLEEPELLESAFAAARLSFHRNRLQAELRARLEELQLERDFIAGVVNAAPAFFCVLDLEGRIIRFNDSLTRQTGIVDDEHVRDRPFWEVFPLPGDAAGTHQAIAAVAPGEHEGLWRGAHGEPIVVAWSLTRVTDGMGNARLVVTGLDVSERVHHEDEIRRERDFLSRVGEATPTLLAVVHGDGVIDERGVNPAFAQATGLRDADAVGRVFWELVGTGDTMTAVRDAFLAFVESRESSTLETAWRSADGSELIVEWWTTSLEAYREDYYLVCGLDVTKRKRDEDEIRRSRARLVAAADAERRRLERNLHDGAQQRLVSLSLALRLAEAKLGRDPDAAAAILSGASEELALALQELRELARGLHPAVLTDRGLGPALDALAERSPVPVELQVEPEERLAPAVEVAVFYVVSESLANVAKYSRAGSVLVRVAAAGPSLVVTVADDGIGGADPDGGTGLRGLVDRVAALDGRVEVVSPAGEGTIVRAELPLGPVREATPQDAGWPHSAVTPKARD